MELNNIDDIKSLIKELEHKCIDELNDEYMHLAKRCAIKYPTNESFISTYLGGWSKLTKIYLVSVKKQLEYLESKTNK